MKQDIDNAFAELGVTPDASEAEVKAAWRRLVSQWHPDRNDSAAAGARMQRINRALEAIRQRGQQAHGSRAGAGSARTTPAPETPAAAEADAGHDTAQAPARTISRKVRLSLEEAAFGCTKVLRGKLNSGCAACDGVGHVLPGGPCPRCQGSGAIRHTGWFGWVGPPTDCDACDGSGLARLVCAACAGSGKAAAQRYQVSVRFPHGVRDGDLLSVDGRRGQDGAPPAELHIRVELQAHALLQLQADGTVLCELPVDGFAWVANRAVEVPTLDGPQPLQLQHDQLSYRLAGRGFPVQRRGSRGDQLVTVTPVFPQRLSTDQQILLDQLIASTSGPDARQPDARLRAWDQALRAWKRGRRD